MALRKLKPTSPGQRFVVRVVQEGLHKGEPHEQLAAAPAEARRPQQPGPDYDAPSGRRSQAPAPRDRLQARQRRHRRPRRAARIRSEPHVASGARAVCGRRAALHPRAAAREARRRDPVGRRRADQAGQFAAVEEHPARHAGALHRAQARQGRAARAQRRRGRADRLARRRVRHGAAALRRAAQGARELPCDDRRSGQRRAQPAQDRQGRCAALARHSADGARRRA